MSLGVFLRVYPRPFSALCALGFVGILIRAFPYDAKRLLLIVEAVPANPIKRLCFSIADRVY